MSFDPLVNVIQCKVSLEICHPVKLNTKKHVAQYPIHTYTNKTHVYLSKIALTNTNLLMSSLSVVS